MAVKDRDHLLAALEHAEAALHEARSGLQQPDASAVTELMQQLGIAEDAVTAFLETIGELLGDRPLTVETARRAAILAAAEQAWENELGPLLTSAQVRELLAGVSRQRVDELLRARRLIGLQDRSGRRRFPAFQFHDGRALEPLIAAYWTVGNHAVDGWTAAAWCVAPDDALDGRSPVQWAREGRDRERLADVARQDAARLSR